MSAKCLWCCLWGGSQPCASLSSDGVTCYQYSCSSIHCCSGQKGRGPSPCQYPDGPLSTTAFFRGSLRLECNSKEMVVELGRSAAQSPLPMVLLPPVTHVVLLYHLTLSGHQQPVPVSSSSWVMVVAELRLNLYILVVSLFSSSLLVFEVLFPKVSTGYCSLGKVQILFYNKGITVFNLSWKSNKRKYLFVLFPTARSQLDTCESSLSLYFFFQYMSISSVCHLSYLIAQTIAMVWDSSYIYKN